MPDSHEFIKPQGKKKVTRDYKTNPFEKYQSKFRSSFGTLLIGILLVFFSFVLLGYSEGVNDEINIIRRTPLIEVEKLTKGSGNVKITGLPSLECDITVPECEENLLYFRKIHEELDNMEWIITKEEETWSKFNLGEITVNPKKAELIFDFEELDTEEGIEYRNRLLGVKDTEKIIVIGYLENKTIKDGKVFIITNKSNSELISFLTEGKTFEWWLYKIVALLLLAFGLTAFILPILAFLDIFPKLSFLSIFLLFLACLVLAGLIVFLTALIITFWWLIFVLIAVVIILLIRIRGRRGKKPISFIP